MKKTKKKVKIPNKVKLKLQDTKVLKKNLFAIDPKFNLNFTLNVISFDSEGEIGFSISESISNSICCVFGKMEVIIPRA